MSDDNERLRIAGRERQDCTKQTIKTVEQGDAAEVFVAQDADPRTVARVIQLCEQLGVKLTYVDTMRNLGKACGIEVARRWPQS
ncbi:ribosomal L7Ae/L30e/S12e/Gadd45 family protein [Cohnella faecalis]|uniref:Ribosomal protein eL8/eL30/eS12/Gadd45 domain-containing protein n=1 Tax=Cohnella faecalis TaxID=2315694 RepID=A0A398CMY6_9BACL|nr:ribosomal L7Ae/L30e/S12e/Gadd45 family protein [Cohnella faecalis]RIE00284.1 hypothetical protein D3H35_29460 [Cohnella faecalis]